MSNCPCCSDILLRHLSSGKLYFQCQSCKTQIPANAVHREGEISEFSSLTSMIERCSPTCDAALKA